MYLHLYTFINNVKAYICNVYALVFICTLNNNNNIKNPIYIYDFIHLYLHVDVEVASVRRQPDTTNEECANRT